MSVSGLQFSNVISAVHRHLPALILISCFVNVLLLVTSIYMLQIYDRVLTSGSLDTLFWLTLVALVAIVIYGVLEQSRRLVLSRVTAFIDSELSAPVLNRSMEERLSGMPASAGIRDVSDLRSFYQGDAILAFIDAPWSAVFIAFIWILHPTLGMIVLAGALVLFGATLLNDLLTRKKQKEAAQDVRAANEAAIRFVEGGGTISPLGMAGALFARWREWQDRARAQQHALGEKTTTILNITRSLRIALQVMVLGSGAFLVLAGEITAGAMIAASIISSRALSPIERLTAAWHRFVAAQSAKGALSRMFGLIDKQPNSVKLPRPSGRLSVEGLTILLPGTRQPILQNLTFAVEPGEIVALIGPSGAGKSTLCRAIVGAWKPSAGCARLDGADTHAWDSEDLGPYLGYLPQSVELFPGTVAENIGRFGEVESAAIIEAARAAGAEQMILRLQNGYETEVGPNGDQISMGQRQRIGLARALFGDPALVVLDEPNSNLDSTGDKALQKALTELKRRGRTVLIVSHRSEILKVVDKVLVLRDGEVERFCPKEELLRPARQPVSPDVAAKASEGRRAGAKQVVRVTGLKPAE